MSLARRLISAGFSDLEKGERFLAAPELEGIDQDVLFAGLQLAASPDAALQSLVRLIEKHPDLKELAAADTDTSEPLYRVLGASEALGEFLIRHPEHLEAFDVKVSPEPIQAPADELRTGLLKSVQADPRASRPVAGITGPEAYEALRTAYRRGVVDLAVKDLCAADPLDFMPAVGAELADLAGAAIEAALAVSRAEAGTQFNPEEVADVGLAVIGMGKCGARELNYISDVDVIYVVEAGELEDARASSIGTALASGISRAISSPAREPGLWEVDANLRPEGKSGPLVRTLDSHRSYYARWAESWEFQALLKARTIAGDADLGSRY
ncbi:MAG: bifunctional glutamine-synthetase adenylyltransferase/deadenyltransferase, partial [Arthrobacter sp.]|nr:bifunctional glutamine-synthetase adenylyltransferase/deadenyltransferase [Arthrobacter sp.]